MTFEQENDLYAGSEIVVEYYDVKVAELRHW
jgi:hypothetical protein